MILVNDTSVIVPKYQIYEEKDRVIVPKYQIYDSTYRVINFFRDRVFNDPEWHPPRRRFVESYF